MKRILLLILTLSALQASAQLAEAEWFVDSDPGVGNGTPITVSTGTTLNESLSVPTTGLAAGTHWLYVRSRHADGRWSLTEPRRFFITDALSAAEYFIDTDPGVGNGTALAITPGGSIDESATVATTGLAAGQHRLYVRTRNTTGTWSLSEGRLFFVNESMVAAEYYIDTDPGNGLGVSIPVTPGAALDASFSISSASLPAGSHRIFIRTQNSSGAWSFVEARTFYVQEQIVQAEYFFDTDPGTGQGIAIPVTTGASVDVSATIATTGLNGGMHDLFVRTRSNAGGWSIVERRRLHVKPLITAAEWFIGTDPGAGNGYPLGIASSSDVDAAVALQLPPCFDAGTRQLQLRTRNEYGQWGLAEAMEIEVPALNPGIVEQTLTDNLAYCRNGATYTFYEPGNTRVVARATSAGTLTNISTNVYLEAAPFTAYQRPFLARHFLLNADNPGNDPVTVRLYFSQAEYHALTAYSPQISHMSRLAIYQYEGPTEDNMLDISDATYQATIDPTAWGQEYDGYWVEFTVTHFSEFWITSSGAPLPAVGLQLQGEALPSANQLAWSTLSESNTDHFEIERSVNGRDWTSIGRQGAAGESPVERRYQFADASSGAGSFFYRVRLVDRDGRFRFSNTIALRRKGLQAWSLAPNPVRTTAMVTGPARSGALAWRIIDGGGRTVGAGQWTAVPGGAYPLQVTNLVPGAYRLLLQAPDGVQELPFVKQ